MFVFPRSPLGDIVIDRNLSPSGSYFITVWWEIKPKNRASAGQIVVAAGDGLKRSYALRHLGIAAHAAGRLDEARVWLEESVRLRREVGFMAGVAANMVGLIYIAAADGRRGDALALAAEAAEIAEASGAGAIDRQIEEARSQALVLCDS
jgi:hypothetical protein